MRVQTATAETAPSTFVQGWATNVVPIPVRLSSCVFTGFVTASSPQDNTQPNGIRFMKGGAEEMAPATAATPGPIACFSRQTANTGYTATVTTGAASSTTSPGKNTF